MRIFTILFLLYLFYNPQIFSQKKLLQTGFASYYNDKFEGRITANGEKYEHNKLTAAHLTLPFGTMVEVTNLENNKSVIVKINDRGPFIKGRIIDVSKSTAETLDFIELGLVKVKIEIIGKAENINKKIEKQEERIPEKINEIKNINSYYSFNINKITPRGYGVQIGSYKEMINLAKLSEEVKLKYGKEVIIQVNKVRGVKLYRIILGTFNTKSEADQFKKELINEFSDCFTVSFQK